MRSSCFFIGHRTAPDSLLTRLIETVERHIVEYDVTEFVVGHYGKFDSLAAHAVRNAKNRHPESSLVLLLPYYPFQYLKEISEEYDRSFYPPGMAEVPKPFAIVRANQYMIRNSEFLICYNEGHVGNTRVLVDMALRRQQRGLMRVENLADGDK